MTDTAPSRLTELESRLAHHERSADDISAVLAEQAREIAALAQRVRRLSERVAAIEAGEAGPPPDERPPHY